MTEPDARTSPDGPSRKSLIKGAFLTFVGAAVVTVLFVLPVEYGIDPTGLGARTGLLLSLIHI